MDKSISNELYNSINSTISRRLFRYCYYCFIWRDLTSRQKTFVLY